MKADNFPETPDELPPPAPIKGDVDTAGITRVSGTLGTDDGLISVPLVGHATRYVVRVDLSGSAPRLVELRVIAADDGGDIDPNTMRTTPVRRLASAAAWFITQADGQFLTVDEVREPRRLSRPERAASRHLDADHYRRVSAALMSARRIGAPAREAVAVQFRTADKPVPLATVDRWIREAKARGYLRRDWRTTTDLDA
ncbi:hypothetical protein GFY24_29640 [Nocardia sp. SYP-A9097]|uniref:hypothetical protein n=1 Tax=Nocardia sp. SYP-A9097 TaxID=2663237 RepID=UPI00129B94A7|nr:hypothetical protein [Nocardia sp. SYP-A9097]MRH91554.1 hypothetical protein [Nocardia sp. SYP-A9097]